jgi:nitroreductase
MNSSRYAPALGLAIGLWLATAGVVAQETAETKLPEPDRTNGKPLMQALNERHSTRALKPDPLPAEVLSNLLWAAWGINRPDSGRRTAPSAVNWQEIDVYLLTADGVSVYDATRHSLKLLTREDVRGGVGRLRYIASAPLNLIYVADLTKMTEDIPDHERLFLSAAGAGHISQNVYLYCASQGLGAVVYHRIDHEGLGKALELRPGQRIILGQSVGYPRK